MPTMHPAKSRAFRILAAALLAAALPACTAFDRFKFAEPAGEVTILGTPKAVRYAPNPPVPRSLPFDLNDCPVGATVYWGQVRNTGGAAVEEVRIVVEVFGATGNLVGRFVDGIYSAEPESDAGKNPTPVTTLEPDQLGVFAVCCDTVPWGTASRAAFRTEFLLPEDEEL